MLFENKNLIINSKKIILRPVQRKDVDGDWWKWLNDKKVTKFMDKGYEKNSKKKQLDYFKKIKRSNKDLLFAICLKNNKHIGCVGLHKINIKTGQAQFGILIGNTKYHGKGIGKYVWNKIIKFGFDNLDLKVINTMIVKDNVASIKIAKSLGFKIKKIFKNFIKKDNKKHDCISLILKKENWRVVKIKINI